MTPLTTRTLITTTTMLALLGGAIWLIGRAEPHPSAAQTPTAPAAPAAAASRPGRIALGANASLGGRRVLAPDSDWNTPIDHLPIDPESATLINTIGASASLHPDFGRQSNGVPWGIPYVVVAGDTKRYPVKLEYADESDHVLYPIPDKPPIEGMPAGQIPATQDGGDHHLLVIDRDGEKLYELSSVHFAEGRWHAGGGAVFELFGNTRRPLGWTSADAAGLPMFPGLVRYDEVIEAGKIEHALRFTAPKTRRAYIAPASHWASREASAAFPPMGLRVRLKASVDVTQFPASVRPILVALKRYGMILADNGGPFFLSGAPDPRWNDAEIDLLKRIKGSDFEVVQMGNITAP